MSLLYSTVFIKKELSCASGTRMKQMMLVCHVKIENFRGIWYMLKEKNTQADYPINDESTNVVLTLTIKKGLMELIFTRIRKCVGESPQGDASFYSFSK